MGKLDKERKLVADRIKKFEKSAQEIHQMADKLHKKMEQLHLQTIATRERARAAHENAESKTRGARKAAAPKPRRAS